MKRIFPLSLVEHFMITALAMAILLGVLGALYTRDDTPSLGGNDQVRVKAEKRESITYTGRGWLVDGRPVRLLCRSEDACTVQWQGGYAWIYRVEYPTREDNR